MKFYLFRLIMVGLNLTAILVNALIAYQELLEDQFESAAFSGLLVLCFVTLLFIWRDKEHMFTERGD